MIELLVVVAVLASFQLAGLDQRKAVAAASEVVGVYELGRPSTMPEGIINEVTLPQVLIGSELLEENE